MQFNTRRPKIMMESVSQMNVIGLVVLLLVNASLFHVGICQDRETSTDTSQSSDRLRSELVNLITSLHVDVKNDLEEITQAMSYWSMSPINLSSKDWILAFRGTAGVGYSVLAAYKHGVGIPGHVESGCKQLGADKPCNNHYRNNTILDNWRNIQQVAFLIYTDNAKVKQIIFNGVGTNYLNWFTQSRVIQIQSSWSDLKKSSANIFSIDGDNSGVNKRAFFINHATSRCDRSEGWFVALDSDNDSCSWGENLPFPKFMYSNEDTYNNWKTGLIKSADAFGVYVKKF